MRFDLIARSQRARRAGRRYKCRHAPIPMLARHLEHASARNVTMKSVIRKQLELRQNLVSRVFLVFFRALQHQDDVALRSWRQIDSRAVLAYALVSLRA